MISSPVRAVSLVVLTGAVLLAGCGTSNTTTTRTTKVTAAHTAAANAADKAFLGEIIPNDQLAVAMAKLAGTHAQKPQLKVFSNRVISADSSQLSQLTSLATTLGVTPSPMKPTMMTGMENDAGALGIQMYQMGMDQVNPTTLATAKPFDKAFLTMMADDLAGAVNMARAELAKGTNPQLRPVATMVVSDAGTGVSQLKNWQSMWYGKSAHSMSGMNSKKGMSGMKGSSGMKGMSHTTTTTTSSGPMSQ